MDLNLRSRSLPFVMLLVILGLCWLGGCKSFVTELRGAPFPEDTATVAVQGLRESSPLDKAAGFSSKARQIEQHLGFE